MYMEKRIAIISTNSHTRAELAVIPSCSGVNLAKERVKLQYDHIMQTNFKFFKEMFTYSVFP